MPCECLRCSDSSTAATNTTAACAASAVTTNHDGTAMRNGLHDNITDIDYHADRNSLSSTGARKLLECPARFRHEQLYPPAGKGVFDFGKLAHKMILGEGADIVEIDAKDYKTKAAQALRDEARAEGKIPALASELVAAKEMTASVRSHPVAAELFRKGEPEKSGYWTDSTGITLRFRPDWLTQRDGKTVCVDLKTTSSADPSAFTKSVVNYGYHLQAAWYIAGLAACGIEADFLFVAVEKTAPYPVSVIELDAEAVSEGARRMRKAVDLYARCLETDTWPAYGDGIHTVSLPYWALKERDQAIYEEAVELERSWAS